MTEPKVSVDNSHGLRVAVRHEGPVEGLSVVQTRNGNARYRGVSLTVMESYHTELVWIDHPGPRGGNLNAGAILPVADMDALARGWLEARGWSVYSPADLEAIELAEGDDYDSLPEGRRSGYVGGDPDDSQVSGSVLDALARYDPEPDFDVDYPLNVVDTQGGVSGQDRKNYTDTQDRESYVPDPERSDG